MIMLDFYTISQQILSNLQQEDSIILATSLNNKVTSRTIGHVICESSIYFQTDKRSEKYNQIKSNRNIALSVKNIQIEALAEIIGHPTQDSNFLQLYKKRFPDSYAKYTNLADEVLIKVIITKAKLYTYIADEPYLDIVDFIDKIAYREPVEYISTKS